MSRAVDGSLEVLGLEGHEALIVAHDDTRHPHVHVIASRVDPETGKAATPGNSKLRQSRWAEGYERDQGSRRRTGGSVSRPPGRGAKPRPPTLYGPFTNWWTVRRGRGRAAGS